MNKNLQKYFEAVRFLESLNNLTHKPELNRRRLFLISQTRMLKLLEQLDNPHLKIKNYIHIAGTSGKGSVVLMFHEILRAAGFSVGSTISPHLQAATERIRINGKYIHPKKFIALAEETKSALEKILPSLTNPLSYQEILFCLSLKAFADAKCDWVIVEALCGGRYDLTNIIPAPRLAVVTNIGHDHLHLIGPSLKDIAREKTGIIKRGSIFLSAETRPILKNILTRECAKQKSPAIFVSGKGNHQTANLRLVREGARCLGISESAVNRGLSKVKLPARFEIVQKNPLVILDGAHNPEKITATAKMFAKLRIKGKRRLIFSSSAGKNMAAMLKIILPLADDLIITRHGNPFRKTITPSSLFRAVRALPRSEAKLYYRALQPKLKPQFFLNAKKAYQTMRQRTSKKDAILVTGSLFTAGEIRELWFPKEKIILQRTSFPK